jgi:outer membrane lipoprotein-sorting protein
MKTLTLAFVLAGLLAVSACSQKKPTVQEPTPAPNTEEMKSRVEAQQNAIKNASDQLQQRKATASPTPSPTAP